ncbi:siderophore-interacting protein [Ornithinimicrobium avium]|uniref:Siderophore-interacting protein n=1 Tax=Ornithinimicrobium avium TaxID=2283195 RepID=A0A345NMU3_9MICO|nr:siderophore-interacting protein [Ornithinimicrobium avium]AXH96351.1 siderophore-interacting protein [Ornithinimicrobium avium]
MNAPTTLSAARRTVTRVASRALSSRAATVAVRAAYSRSTAMPLERTEHRCVPGTVIGAADVAPWLRRLTLHVPGLRGYEVQAPDEYVGLVMPRPGTTLPDLSSITGPHPRPVLATMPEEDRPDVRWYTVSDWRPQTAELDVEVVLHPEGEVDEGPGATWVRAAAPGDAVAVQTGTACYHQPADARVQVVAGDETAYPSIAGIIEAARGTDRELHVFLELARADALPALPQPERGSLTLVDRVQTPGEALLVAVRAADLPAVDYGWVCGEQQLAAGVRKHLVGERGLGRTDVYFCAYWILGRARG